MIKAQIVGWYVIDNGIPALYYNKPKLINEVWVGELLTTLIGHKIKLRFNGEPIKVCLNITVNNIHYE